MFVPDMRYVVHRIQIASARVIKEVLPPAALHVERFFVRHAQVFAQMLLAELQDFRCSQAGRWRWRRLARDQQPGVGTKAFPDRPFVGKGHAREVALLVQHIQNHLKMQVRRPVTIFRHRADLAKFRARQNSFSHFQTLQRGPVQVSVQRKKRQRIRYPVLQNDGGAVIAVVGIVLKTVHFTIQRRKNGRSWRQKNVEANVNAAPFGALIALYRVGVGGVKRADFVVAANAGRTIMHRQDVAVQFIRVFDVAVIAEVGAAHAEVEPDSVFAS